MSRLTLEIPMTGEHFWFRTSARGPGQQFRFTWTLGPGCTGPPEHVHPAETERFDIHSGTLRVWIRGVPKDYGPGESVTIAEDTPHRFLNPGPEPLVTDVTLSGTAMEDALVPMALAFEGRTRPRLGEIGKMIVHDVWAQGSVGVGAMGSVMSGLAAALRLVGFRPWERALAWERPE